MFVAQRGQDFTLSYSHGVSSSQKASLADLEKVETTWNCMSPPARAIATQRVQQCRRACRVEIGSFQDGFMVNQTAWQVFLFNLFMLFFNVSLFGLPNLFQNRKVASRYSEIGSWLQNINICRQRRIPDFEQNRTKWQHRFRKLSLRYSPWMAVS